MAAPLAVCTKEEQRAVIRFIWSEGVSGAEIHRRLSTKYGGSALPCRSVYQWIEKFRSGRTTVMHEEGAGHPSTSTTEAKIQQAQEMVLANQRVTIDQVACSLQISHGLHIQSSTTSSASIKSVQDGCQESLLQSTSANVLRSANAYSTATTMKAKNFLAEYSHKMKCGYITMSQNPKAKVWHRNTGDRQRRRNSRLNLPREM
jgi:transposase